MKTYSALLKLNAPARELKDVHVCQSRTVHLGYF